MDGSHVQQKERQPSMVANPACGQSGEQRNNCIFHCPRSRLRVWCRGQGSAVPTRVSLLNLLSRLNLELTHGVPQICCIQKYYSTRFPLIL